ncbi:hypothetical protein B484DRAFT_179556 [Ochromonadaceae sp. CCMP2298]|nr:hypothetical protein B484DRAFT_179556 [Ochromonadaceae sp. CCMP2298]
MKAHKPFRDASSGSLTIPSSWKKERPGKSVRCQTSADIYQFREMETQTGLYTNVVQSQVPEEYKDLRLLEYLCKTQGTAQTAQTAPGKQGKQGKQGSEEQWRSRIQDGFVTVDCEVTTDPEARLDTEFFLEYVDERAHAGTQTTGTGMGTDTGIEADTSESKGADSAPTPPGLGRFVQRAGPMMLRELQRASRVDASGLFAVALGGESEEGGGAAYWRCFSVDLERHRVVYPDWSRARHFKGVVVKCTVTRNKERTYEVEYEDGAALAVREEYVRILGEVRREKGDKDSKGGPALQVRDYIKGSVFLSPPPGAKSGLLMLFTYTTYTTGPSKTLTLYTLWFI